MWYLKNSKGEIIYLKPNKLMIVSRKNDHDIVLTNDASISKLHASINVRPKINFKNNEPSSTVVVQDTGSKYGTFIIASGNKLRKLPPSQDQVLDATDRIKFGLQKHEYTLHYVPLIISTSTLSEKEKIELQNIIDSLDGVIIKKWEEYCTHLTVSNVTLTTQVVQALAFGTCIVNLKYWNAVLKKVEKNEPIPETSDFIPSIREGSINSDTVSLEINLQRKILFKGLIFVSFSAPQSPLKEIINCAGGKLMLFQEDRIGIKQLCSKNIVVLQLANIGTQPSQSYAASYDLIQDGLHEKGLRLVPESDIFLAILYCSIEKYCNPKFHFKKLIGGLNKSRKALSDTVLEPDTEDNLLITKRVPAVVIKETLTASEQSEEQQSQTLSKAKKFSLRLRSADSNKKISDKSIYGSEESSCKDIAMSNDTRSSIESDSDDAAVKRRILTDRTDDDRIKKLNTSIHSATIRTVDLHSRLQTSQILRDKIPGDETSMESSSKNFGQNIYLNPSTSKEDMETPCRNRSRDVPDEIPKQRGSAIELSLSTRNTQKVNETSSSSVTDGQRSPKRTTTDQGNMFSFVNKGAAKRKRKVRDDPDDDLFELLEDPNAKNSRKRENIFEKELNKIKKCQPNRRRSSLSSNDSSVEDEPPVIKVEKVDSEVDDCGTPLVHCKKEFDNSMDETCKSTIMPLLRTDIDLTLDDSTGYSKTFVKVYNMIPEQRIKLKNMYVWKSQDEIKYEANAEDSTSSDDDDDSKFQTNTGPKVARRRK